MAELLKGQRALVTGGGSGIGRATCKLMAAEGAQVAVVDLSEDAARAVAEEISAMGYCCDVTDYPALQSCVSQAAEAMGGLSILFNNAGSSAICRVHDWPQHEWDRIVKLNLSAVFYGIKAAAPLMLKGKGGAIVNTSSISGVRPAAGEAPYAAAKAGVAALTCVAALEYGPSIRVNSVSPGMVRTAMTEPMFETFPGIEADLATRAALKRIGEPEDIAAAVVFLCSDMARFITGQNLVVDGGLTLHGSAVDGALDRLEILLQDTIQAPPADPR